MRRFFRFCFLVLSGLFLSSAALAQIQDTTGLYKLLNPEIPARPENFRIGLRFAMAHFSGDVQPGSVTLGEVKAPFTPGGDLFFGYRFGPVVRFAHIGLKGLFGYRQMGGSSTYYEFSTTMFPLSISLYTELFANSTWRPILSAGLSLLPYTLDVKRSNFPPKTFTKEHLITSESGLAGGIPLQVGLVRSMTRALDVELTFETMVAFTDRMDGIVSQARDNVETIGFGFLYYFYNAKTTDTDADGLSDEAEDQLGTDIRDHDTDDDGLTDYEELETYPTDPLLADVDNDGLNDYEEVIVYKTNPRVADTDRDRLNDYQETKTHNTNPLLPDSDSDGLSDYDEITVHSTDPNRMDSDDDGLDDPKELEAKTDPRNPDTDGDGVKDGADQCPHEKEIINGFDDQDGCPDEVPPLPATLEVGQVVILENIEFETSSARITDFSNPSLAKALQALISTPGLVVEIGGHTDSTGDYERNKMLSLRRAESVKGHLVSKGIAPERIETVGYGPDEPIDTNETPEGRARNRRIEFKILRVE